MHHRKPARAETPIERIFREETGRKMPTSLRSILLHKPMAERDPHLRLVPAAQIEGNRVVYSIILTKVKDPLSRGDVERHFEGEVFRK